MFPKALGLWAPQPLTKPDREAGPLAAAANPVRECFPRPRASTSWTSNLEHGLANCNPVLCSFGICESQLKEPRYNAWCY